MLDFESFFDRKAGYSLSNMSTEGYVRDQRFKAHGAAIKWGSETNARWYDERQLRFILKNEDWSDTFCVCHHCQFDGLILSHHYDVHPARMGCTLSMARLVLGNHLSVSLDAVRKHFGMPGKSTPYHLFEGKGWDALSPDAQRQLADGACDEVESIWVIFHMLMTLGFPKQELRVIDTTIKMFTEPALVGDIPLLAQIWQTENDNKQGRLDALGISASDLQSAEKFAALLRQEGVEPETKQGKNGAIYAFAKTDQFMRDLLEDDNDRVRLLAEARLGEKSTLLQTRAATLGWMARRGPMPVYLRYAGAHTTRWSGGDGCNWQNFKRGSDIRKAIMAPQGWLLAAIDLSQIECRLLNYLAGQEDVVEKFKNKEDPYIGIASNFYNRPITKADISERGTGKQAELSCGYGCGAVKFQATARLGIYGPPVVLSLDAARSFVELYRATHRQVVEYWRQAESFFTRIAAQAPPIEWGPMRIHNRRICLPNGAPLIYDTLEWCSHDALWRMRTRHGWTKMYGAKLVENVVQALARVVLSEAMLRIEDRGYRIVNCTHDELLVLVQNDLDAKVCAAEMERTPSWLPGIPIECEWSLGERYSK